jgi:hypothetical protein
MKKSLLAPMLLYGTLCAQINGTVSVPGTFSTIASVISSLNNQGTSSGVTVNIAAGYSENVIAGGYSLYASGSSSAPIVFRKNGNGSNPLLIAYTGNRTPGSASQDGCLRLIGSDYVTIDGIDIADPNTSNPATMEFGMGLFRQSAYDGCRYNTIRNCNITLSRVNNASGSAPAADGSRGIDIVNALVSSHNSPLTVMSADGSNSFNSVYNNTVNQCNIGISLWGYSDSSPYNLADHGNYISYNTLFNFGGGGIVSASSGIRASAQYDIVVANNLLNNNNGNGANHAATLRGIYLLNSPGAALAVTANTITVNGGGTGSQLSVIENAAGVSGTSNTVQITANLITDCTNMNSVSGIFYGIWNSANAFHVYINANRFINNSTGAASGSTYLIYNSAPVSNLSVSGNTLAFAYNGASAYSGSFYGISNTATNSLAQICNNRFSGLSHQNVTGSGSVYLINNTGQCGNLNINANHASGLVMNHTGAESFVHNASATSNMLSVCNNSFTNYLRTAATGNLYCYYGAASSSLASAHVFTANCFSNITASQGGSGSFYGIYNTEGGSIISPLKTISANTITAVNINGTGSMYGIYAAETGAGGGNSASSIAANLVSDLSFSDGITGLYLAGSTSSSLTMVHSNTINNLSCVTGTATGVLLSGQSGHGMNYFNNRIAGIVANGTVGVAHGLYVSGTGTLNIYNNLAGHISAPNSSGSNRVNGIYLSSSASVNFFYNTILLSGSATNTNTGSNCLYAFTGSTLNLRNNILVNAATPAGTAIAAAYRRSGSGMTNYASSSNNNLFYAGNSGTNNVIFHNGSAYQGLSAFQTYVSPREAASVTQSVSFLGQNSGLPAYLHLNPAVTVPAESGALNLNGITADHDSDIRQGNAAYAGSGTAPDIGADEFELNTAPCSSVFPAVVTLISPTLCAGQGATLISNNYAPGSGMVFQWKVSSSASGPFTNLSGANAVEYVSPPLTSGIYFYQLENACNSNSLSTASIIHSVQVFAIPSSSVTVNPLIACTGQSVNFSGSSNSSTSYFWYGPGGFSSLVQNPSFTVAGQGASGIYAMTAFANGCASPLATLALSVSDLTVNLSASAGVICLGFSATLSVSSIASSYSWSSGPTSASSAVSPSVNTTYSVTITGSTGCVLSRTISVAVVNPTIAAVNAVVCYSSVDGTLSVNTFSNSTVSWFAGPTSTQVLGTGTQYTVNSSSSVTYYAEAASGLVQGCQSPRIPVTLTVTSIPTLSAVAVPATICPGSTCALIAAGAANFSWTSSGSGSQVIVSPTAAAIYTVSGWSQQPCLGSATVAVVLHTIVTVGISPPQVTVCPLEPLSLTASGAVSYTWSTGSIATVVIVYPALNSTFTVTGSGANGCSASSTVAVSTRSLPLVKITPATYTICPGESVLFQVSGALSYTWLPGNFSGTSASFTPYVSSVYNVIGLGVNSCTNVAFGSIVVDECVGGEIKPTEQHVRLYPVPATNFIRINSDEIIRSVVLSDMTGKILLYQLIETSELQIDICGWLPGLYLLDAQLVNGGRSRLKFVVE